MNNSDFIVSGSFLLVLIALLTSLVKRKLGKERFVASNLIALSFGVLFLGFFLKNTMLTKSLVFGIIAGSLCQPIFADPYLIKKTLIYRKEGWRFIATPWWMALLWGIAVTQLVYTFSRVIEIPFNPRARYVLLIIAGSIYFYIFELFVNNLTFWWKRENCWQPFNVALYATLSEVLAVQTLLLSCSLLAKGLLSWPWIICFSIVAGITISLVFIMCCNIFYKKQLS